MDRGHWEGGDKGQESKELLWQLKGTGRVESTKRPSSSSNMRHLASWLYYCKQTEHWFSSWRPLNSIKCWTIHTSLYTHIAWNADNTTLEGAAVFQHVNLTLSKCNVHRAICDKWALWKSAKYWLKCTFSPTPYNPQHHHAISSHILPFFAGRYFPVLFAEIPWH